MSRLGDELISGVFFFEDAYVYRYYPRFRRSNDMSYRRWVTANTLTKAFFAILRNFGMYTCSLFKESCSLNFSFFIL